MQWGFTVIDHATYTLLREQRVKLRTSSNLALIASSAINFLYSSSSSRSRTLVEDIFLHYDSFL